MAGPAPDATGQQGSSANLVAMDSLRPAQKHEGGQQGWAGSAVSTFLAIDSLKSPVQMHGECASRSERQTQRSLGQLNAATGYEWCASGADCSQPWQQDSGQRQPATYTAVASDALDSRDTYHPVCLDLASSLCLLYPNCGAACSTNLVSRTPQCCRPLQP